MNEHFANGFEKQAAKINFSMKPAKDLFEKIKNKMGGTPEMVGPMKPLTYGDKARNWLNSHKKKTIAGMTLVGAPALLYGGYKAVDSVIGTPSHDGQDW